MLLYRWLKLTKLNHFSTLPHLSTSLFDRPASGCITYHMVLQNCIRIDAFLKISLFSIPTLLYKSQLSIVTFFKCLLTHFVKVFFCMASRSSEEEGISSMRKHLLTSTYVTAMAMQIKKSQVLTMDGRCPLQHWKSLHWVPSLKNLVPLSLSRRDPAKMTWKPRKLLTDVNNAPPPLNRSRSCRFKTDPFHLL